MHLTRKITAGAVIGALAGYFFPEYSPYFKKISDTFVNLINMIVVLLVLSTVALGIVHFKTPQTLLKIARRTILLFVGFTLVAFLLGMAISTTFGLGNGLHLTTSSTATIAIPSVSAMLLSWIPANPLASIANGNIIQILIFACFLGVAINAAGHKGRPITECLESISEAMQQITTLVLAIAPLGIFAIVAYTVGDFQILPWTSTALKFFALYLLGAFILVFAIYGLCLRYFWKFNIFKVLKGMRDALYIAFATCSSTATLPVTMHCMTTKIGISRDVASFVSSLGATLNLNGLALFNGMSAIFVAQAYDISLDPYQIAAITVTSILMTFGAGGIPGAGLLQLYATFSAIGLPVEGIAWMSIFEVFREMISTVLNVLGDAVTGVAVAQGSDKLDENTFFTTANHEWESSI